jgi:hypothetical protein
MTAIKSLPWDQSSPQMHVALSCQDFEAADLWVCPAPVPLAPEEIAAALYAFSDLIDDCPHPRRASLLEEVRFVITRHGTDSIERVADWLAMCGPAPLPALLAVGTAGTGCRRFKSRLAWCRMQALLLSAPGNT